MKQYILNEIIKASKQFNEIYVNATLHTRKGQPLFLDLMTTNGTRRSIELNLTLDVMDGAEEEVINPEIQQLIESNNILSTITNPSVECQAIDVSKEPSLYVKSDLLTPRVPNTIDETIINLKMIASGLTTAIKTLERVNTNVIAVRLLSETEKLDSIILELENNHFVQTDLTVFRYNRVSLSELLNAEFTNKKITTIITF